MPDNAIAQADLSTMSQTATLNPKTEPTDDIDVFVPNA